LAKSAGPSSGVLLSVTMGKTMSWQIGFELTILVKLQSFLVAAEVACSSGDLPVVTVEATLVAVTGLATAAVAAVVPTELAAAVPLAPSAAKGAAQPEILMMQKIPSVQIQSFVDIEKNYFNLQSVLKIPAVQLPLAICSNLLSGVLLSETTLPVPLLPENSLNSIGR
jgi:hypothetical protein